MATPIVHASMGLIITSSAIMVLNVEPWFRDDKQWKMYSATIVFSTLFSCLPDLDLLFSYITTGDVRTYHFGITHSFFFCFIVWAAIRAGFNPKLSNLALVLLLSHVLVDSFTGEAFGMSKTSGIQFLLPFSSQVFVFDFTIFPGIDHSDWWLPDNVLRIFFDIIIFAPMALAYTRVAINHSKSRLVQ